METLTVDLDIEGMTCASCVARVEKRLTRIEGVDARVNLATERARVSYPADVPVDTLLEAVDAAGYRATLVEPEPPATATATEGVGTEPSARRDPLTRRLAVSAALAIPVVLVAMIPALQFPGWQWASLALATPVVLWGGWPFHRAAAVNLRHGALTMDTLVSLGTLTAYLWSVQALVFGHAGEIGMRHEWVWGVRGMPGGDVYFEVAAGVVAVILAGRVLEARSKRRAGRALRALADLAPSESTLVETDASGQAAERRIPLADLRAGDRFAVRPGERIAADGVVVEGEAAVDERMLTGEPAPVDVEPGSHVTGATIVVDGRLVIEATRVGADARLAQIARLVDDAQVGSSRAQRLADRISAVFVPVVIALAIATGIVWSLTGSPVEHALTAAVAVLVIACPCALGLATPMAILVGTGRGAARGILITGPEALDRTGQADTIVLDKTGTLTTGRMRLTGVVAEEGRMPRTRSPWRPPSSTARSIRSPERSSRPPNATAWPCRPSRDSAPTAGSG
ncbi:cation-translocating P-type ATPase [Agromyces protaetiae]|uniref:heavy metal translocating P-type ATPase n=1 Tax=Agromyces protaetiae TaxID=2509455 RepID=UPI0026CDC284